MGEEDEPGTGSEKSRHPGASLSTLCPELELNFVLVHRNSPGIQNPSSRFLRQRNALLFSLKSSNLALVTPSTSLSSVL
jgi:hypothetical protein